MNAPRILIAGSGRQAVAAGYDLVRFQPNASLTLTDADAKQAASAAQKILSLSPSATITAEGLDVQDTERLAGRLRDQDAVLAGVPYHLNPLVHLAAAKVGIPSVDMGSDLPELEAALGPRERYSASVAVFDSGLAPGLGNQIAASLIEDLPHAEGVKILCGGLPLEPRTPLKYKPRFSLEGLVGEYSDPAVGLRDGEVAELRSLEDLETVDLGELGAFEAFTTSGGSSIGAILHRSKLRTYEYKTLRFPGHAAAMLAYRDLGLWQEENFAIFERLFNDATGPEDDRDQVILVVEAWSSTDRKRVVIKHNFDPTTGLSAMEQLTGFSSSIVLQKALEFAPKPGLYAAEELVSGSKMLEELAKRGVRSKA